jgi:hypothetical protein
MPQESLQLDEGIPRLQLVHGGAVPWNRHCSQATSFSCAPIRRSTLPIRKFWPIMVFLFYEIAIYAIFFDLVSSGE